MFARLLRFFCLLFFTFFTYHPKSLFAEEDFLEDSGPIATYLNVDLRSGAYVPSSEDLIVEGPEPLSFCRFYNSQSEEDEFGFGAGISLNHAYRCQFPVETGGMREAKIQLPGGGWVSYFAENGKQEFYLDPQVFTCGWRNVANQSFVQSLRASCLSIDSKKELYLHLRSGSTRIYSSKGLLKKELCPSGNRLFYSYTSDKKLNVIEAKDKSETITLGKIYISWGETQATITGSNGRQVKYFFSDKTDAKGKKHKILNQISHIGQTTNVQQSYLDERSENSLFITGHRRSDSSCYCRLTYDNRGAVTEVKAPVTAKGNYYPIATFKFQGANTIIEEPYGYKKTFIHDANSYLVEIREEQNGVLLRSQFFIWGKEAPGARGKEMSSNSGNLLVQGIKDSAGNIKSATFYQYDRYGRVTKETACGNFSQALTNYPTLPALAANNPVPPANSGQLTRHYQYITGSKGLNLDNIQEANGLTLKLNYVACTDRLAAKFTLSDNKVVRREFYTYNQIGALIKKIQDDGSGGNSDDLRDVTERRITDIAVEETFGKEGFGLPVEQVDSYLDLESGSPIPLQRVYLTYGKGNVLSKKEVFASDDELLYTIDYTYDDFYRLIEETTPLGQVKQYSYYQSGYPTGKLASEQLVGAPFSHSYHYDLMKRKILSQVNYQSGDKLASRYSYNFNSQLILEQDAYGNQTQYRYDPAGRLVNKTLSPVLLYSGAKSGTKTAPSASFDFDIFNRLIQSNDNGASSIKSYNSRGQVSQAIIPGQNAEFYSYHRSGQLICKKLKNGSSVHYGYDALQRLILEKTLDAKNQLLKQTQYIYDRSRLKKSIDSNGVETCFDYDGAGRKIHEEKIARNGEKRSIDYEWDHCGRLKLTRKWGEEGRFIEYHQRYDRLGRTVESYSIDQDQRLLAKKLVTYDLLGNVIEEASFLDENTAAVTKTLYNERSEVICQIDPMGHETHIEWNHLHKNPAGDLVLQKTTTDPLGSKTIETFDNRGLVATVEKRDPLNQQTAYQEHWYNLQGKEHRRIYHCLKNQVLERTYTVDWEYDTNGNLTQVTEQKEDEAPKITRSKYDSCGRLIQVIHPSGISFSRSYDALDRLSTLISSDGTIDERYHYDSDDHIVKIEDFVHNTVTERTYDDFGALIQETLGNQLTMEYSYYPGNYLKQIKLPDGSLIEYDFDGANLTAIARKDKNRQLLYRHEELKTNFQGKALQSKLINGAMVERSYDLLSRPTQITSFVFSEWLGDSDHEGYDSVGNLRYYRQRDPLGTQENHFDYDVTYQLTEEKGMFTHTYENDSLHNRRAKDGTRYEINAFNQITDDGQFNYRYDATGNLSKKEKDGESVTSYRYDALNRLIEVTRSSQKITYQYDSFGRRLFRRFYHLSGGNFEGNSGENWALQKTERFLYQGTKEIGSVDEQGCFNELRVLGASMSEELGGAIAIEIQGEVYAPYHDHRGNVVALWSLEHNRVAESYRYSAFGSICYYGAYKETLTSSKVQNPWLFASKRLDLETDLFFFGKRYYNPDLGRWQTQDPAGYADGPNLYSYVHNQALTHLDPQGLFAFFLSFALGSGSLIPSFGFSVLGAALCLAKTDRGYSVYSPGYTPRDSRGFSRQKSCYDMQNRSSLASLPFAYYPNQMTYPLPKEGNLKLSNHFESGMVTGKNFANASIRVITGMCCQIEDASKWAQERSRSLDNHSVLWTCHITEGKLTDAYGAYRLERQLDKIDRIRDQTLNSGGTYQQMREASFWQGKNIKNMDSVCHVANQFADMHAQHTAKSQSFRIYVEAHSRGALELYAATKLLPHEVRKTLHIYTLGAAYFVPKEDFGDALNYVNPHDPIPKCAQQYFRMKSDVTIINTKITCSKDGQDTLEDHRRDSPGYQWAETDIRTRILDYARD